MVFSDKLQILRKQVNLTQDEFAIQIGVSRQAISKWESGTAYPDLKNLQTLCSFFSVTPNTLLNPNIEDLTPCSQSTAFDILSLSENLRRLRVSHGIAQESFAEMMNVSRQSVSNWEKGTALPKTELLIAMLDVLETDFDQLLPPVPVPESKGEEACAEKQAAAETIEVEALPPKKKMKKSTKLLLVLLPAATLLIALVALVTIGAILTSPFLSADPFGEAVETVLFDTAALDNTAERWANEGIVITLGPGQNPLELEITSDKDYLSIKGLSVQGDTIVRLPRKNIKAAMAASKLSPSSHSSVALSEEDYALLEKLLCAFESNDLEQPFDRTLAVLYENLATEISAVAPPKKEYSLAEGEFALTKTVTYTLDKDALFALMDALERIAETPEAKELEFLLQYDANATSPQTFASLVRRTRNRINVTTDINIVLSYSVTKGKLDGVTFESSVTSNDKAVTKTALCAVCLLGESGEIGLDVTHFSSTEEKGTTIEEQTFYTYRKKDAGSVLDLTLTSETLSTYKKGADSQTFSTTGNRQIVWDRGTGNYWYIATDPELEMKTTVEGTFVYNTEAGSLSFSLNHVTINQESLFNSEQLCISVTARGTEPMQGTVKDLFSLSERELITLYRDLPAKKFEILYNSITGESFGFVYSKEGLLVSPDLVERADGYADAFLAYLQADTEESKQIQTKNIYIYDEIADAYVLLRGDQHFVSVSAYAYELTAQMKKNNHQARILSNGELEVHKMQLISSVPPTCQGYGEERYQCIECQAEYSVAILPLYHDRVVAYHAVRTDDNVERTAEIEKCSQCNMVFQISIPGFLKRVHVDKNGGTTYKITSYDADSGSHMMFSIPESLLELVPITAINDIAVGAVGGVIRIPTGVSGIKKDTFKYCASVKVLILPSTLTQIANDAFGDMSKLHTIYYCGTEEQWKRVRLNQYATDWADVNVVFCPDGVTPEMIMDSLE